jgi:hypothetical protein
MTSDSLECFSLHVHDIIIRGVTIDGVWIDEWIY